MRATVSIKYYAEGSSHYNKELNLIYRFVATVSTTVDEDIEIEIDADDYEDAKDIAYDILDDPEHSEFVADRYRTVTRYYGERTVVNLEDMYPAVNDSDED